MVGLGVETLCDIVATGIDSRQISAVAYLRRDPATHLPEL